MDTVRPLSRVFDAGRQRNGTAADVRSNFPSVSLQKKRPGSKLLSSLFISPFFNQFHATRGLGEVYFRGSPAFSGNLWNEALNSPPFFESRGVNSAFPGRFADRVGSWFYFIREAANPSSLTGLLRVGRALLVTRCAFRGDSRVLFSVDSLLPKIYTDSTSISVSRVNRGWVC